MVSTLVSFTALFTAVFTLLMGVGLLNTLLSLRMTLEGFSPQRTGLIMAAYFAGLVMGSLTCHRLIRQVGHIRAFAAFAAFAAVATAAIMLHGLHISALVWGLLRLSTGITTIGLYMIIASTVISAANSPYGLFFFSSFISATYAVIIFYFRKQKKVELIPVEDQVDFMPMNKTSSGAIAIDPRGEIETEK